MTFKDNFSKVSAEYAQYRPHYPSGLFAYLNSLVTENKEAWDCGTGNGQVALELTKYFNRVYASDASEKQVLQAQKNEKIEYFVSLAEETPIRDRSLDLITVAQAFHWFDAEKFFLEAKRILKPQGILALWCYDLFDLPNASKDLKTSVDRFCLEVEPFWDKERKLVENGYKSIDFPLAEIFPVPSFSIKLEWTAQQLLGYLSTWSSSQKYRIANGDDSLSTFAEEISQNYIGKMEIQWDLHFRIGKNS